MKKNSDLLIKHLHNEHKISPFSQYLREIVYGGTDGIVTTFAVVSGFSGAAAMGNGGLPALAVLLFGFANLFADAASMGLGNFLSIRSNQDVYREEERKELHEIKNNPKMEIEETIEILKEKGYSGADAQEMAKLYSKNEKYWLDFMMSQELERANPERDNPYLTGLATFLSFISFGFLPLIPYILTAGQKVDFIIPCSISLFGLLLLGLLRYKVTKESVFRSIGETVLLGSVAGGIAYLVGTFFR